jgi:hypothetical protein
MLAASPPQYHIVANALRTAVIEVSSLSVILKMSEFWIFHAGAFAGICCFLARTQRLVATAQSGLITMYLHTVPIGVGALSGGVERSGHKSGDGCAAQKYGTHAKLLSVF